MTEDEALLAAAVGNPAEHTPRLALADWFDEHAEPALAEALREEPHLVPFLAVFIRWDMTPFWNGILGQPDRRTADNRRFALAACRLLTRFPRLFAIPPDAPTRFDPDAKSPAGADRLPSPEGFLARWADARTRQVTKLRGQAARFAANPPRAMRMKLEPQIDPEGFESIACTLHELALRNRTASLDYGDVEKAMRERGHPLAWLPPWLLPIEAEIHFFLPRFHPDGHGVSGGETVTAPVGGPPEPPAEAPVVIRVEDVPWDSPAFAAVAGWQEASNGLLEAKVFHLDKPLEHVRVGAAWFSGLPADSLASEGGQWVLNRSTAAAAIARLFASAQSGGAYGRWEWGAYGRLYAWRSFGWLAGCDPAADAVTIAAEAARCEWLTFGGTEWFHDVAWDLGLICVRPDHRTVALLAATDTD